MIDTVHYESYSRARTHLKDLLDAATVGLAATIRRDDGRVAVVDAERLRRALTLLTPSDAVVVAEAGGWSAFLPGLPIAADGATFDEALDDLVLAVREYAADWNDHLRLAPNHEQNWGVVQLIELSSDPQLREWLVGPQA